jgi:hypothetical protein
MNNEYCDLLKRQVLEEIHYLKSIGHDTKHPDTPCMFCHEFQGKNFCKRIETLNQFLTQINIHLGKQPDRAIRVGLKHLDSINLPLMYDF